MSEILKRTLVFQPRSQGLFPRKLGKPEKALGTRLSQLYHIGLLCQLISAKFAKQRVLRVALGPFRLFIAFHLDLYFKTLTLFMTKICDISYPFYDLTKTSKPYL